MKFLLIFFLLPLGLKAQEYKTFGDFKYLDDTLIFNGRKIVPGDTINVGFGSGEDKKFLFIMQQTSNMKKYINSFPYLLTQYANTKLIFKRIDIVDKKQSGVHVFAVEPIFGFTKEDEKIEWTVQLTNASKSNEIYF